ncbi:J domain-containing protein [Parasphingopyxis algicola]|uniref:J domain-containing protein n=1 Tax=Parasphingopyxis algicola TaxID=2026624 RepID=UPI0015A2E081|nr:J domain-containing protein [Parasphingopyxis algicola]QLC26911.1 J domain-containing protein [Parasphingopyxis algicola]
MCDHPGCSDPGEFRAPKTGHRRGGFDGPGDYYWLCLDHVRAFNAGYDYFDGMSEDEIYSQQRPWSGWDRETRAFAANGASPTPRWHDFTDPLDAIGARFRTGVRKPRTDGKPLTDRDRENLQILGLDADSDRKTLRRRYAALVRQYHPDKNGGDRSREKMLQRVIDAYTQLKDSPVFS